METLGATAPLVNTTKLRPPSNEGNGANVLKLAAKGNESHENDEFSLDEWILRSFRG